MKKTRLNLEPIAGWLITSILLPLALLSAFASQQANLSMGLNSDLVQSHLQIHDFIADPQSLADWHLPPALSFFPDWLVGGLLALLAPSSPAVTLAGYPALLLYLYCVAGGLLLSQVVRASPLQVTWMLAAVMVLAAISTYHEWTSPLSTWLFISSAFPNIHTGAVLMTLLCAWLLLKEICGTATPYHRFLLPVIVWLTAFSDAIFVVWFLLPTLGLLAAHAWHQQRWAPLKLAAIIATSGFSAVIVERLLRTGLWPMKLIAPTQSLEIFSKDIFNTIAAGDGIFTVMVLTVLVIQIRGIWIVNQFWRRNPITPRAYQELFIAGAILAALGSTVLTGIYSEIALWRYLLIVPALVVIWTMSILLNLLNLAASRTIRQVTLASAVGIVLIGGSAQLSQATTNITQLSQPSPLEVCLQGKGRTTGFGDYWTAKELMFRSYRRLHILQLTQDGKPFRWVYNERWYQVRANDGSPVRPDFIILNRLDPAAMLELFGAPDDRLQCAAAEIWLYDHPLSWAARG